MNRSFAVDGLKMIAAQWIVMHHLSAYGPLSLCLQLEWPRLMDAVFEYGRMAVHVFLVIGGFLTARSLQKLSTVRPVQLIGLRFTRLVPIYAVALLFVSVSVALLRPAVGGDWLPDPPTLWQVVVHLLLLDDLVDVSALSSGVWYVAMDLELYALQVLLYFSTRKLPVGQSNLGMSLAVAALCAASLLVFNRHPEWDSWVVYFAGSYGLGILAAWAKRSRFDGWLFVAILCVAATAIAIEPRARIGFAMFTAVWLSIASLLATPDTTGYRLRAQLADSTYALFLSHFGVIVVFSAAWNLLGLQHPWVAVAMAVCAWACSVLLGVLLHSQVEQPINRWIAQRWQPR